MAHVLMPRLVDGMEEGTLLVWLVAEGDEIAAGQDLAEIETDKATVTYASELTGRLRRLVEEGETVAVGRPIAAVSVAGDAAEALPSAAAASRENGARRSRPKASPVARRVAREHGVALDGLEGSGPHGRIVRADVLSALARAGTDAAAETPSAVAGDPRGRTSRAELSRVQRLVAQRMTDTKASVPEFAVTATADVESLVDLRRQVKDLGLDAVPSYNDMVIKAAALALRDHPLANSAYQDGAIDTYSRINVGMAVAAPGSLIVPTIFDADQKSLGDIARTTRTLAAKVRDGTIAPDELRGGTFTVSNLGMFGVESFHAIINAPQAAILAVGALQRAPTEHDGAVALRHRMTLTLTCDHRVLYGADAAAFLQRITRLLESPLHLCL